MDNSNYQETDERYERRPGAPDAKHKSRISWIRVRNLERIRQDIAELRERQNQRNEEYRRTHGNG